MQTELIQDLWNNYIAIPHNRNGSHNFSVSDLKKIVEKYVPKDKPKRTVLPLKVGKTYQTREQVPESFTLTTPTLKEVRF